MVDSHSAENGAAGAARQNHGAEDPEVIAQLLDAVMAGDRQRCKDLLKHYPHLREEFEGLTEAYSEVRSALRNHPECFGQEYEEIRRDLAELPEVASLLAESDKRRFGELSKAMRDWPHPKVVAFYQAFASSVVGVIAEEAGHDLPQHRIRKEGAYLCSRGVLERLRVGAQQGRHVRNLLVELLAERWEDPTLPQRLPRERLEELLEESGIIDHIRHFEAFLAAVA